MDGKFLGKITFAEFGQYSDRPFLFGLQLGFEFNGGGVYDGGRYTANISNACKWDSESQRQQIFMNNLEELNKILTDAKVNYVSALKGKPVEVEIVGNTFKGFRILTEVI